MNIVLLEPEIPANTGNIGRSCAATHSRLHLIRPLGFQLDEKHLRRAGMDYWEELDVTVYDDYRDFLARNPGARLFYATTKAKKALEFQDKETDYSLITNTPIATSAVLEHFISLKTDK